MKWKWKRPAAFLLAAAMIFTMPGVPASAVEAGVSAVHTGLCEHHPEHTEDCGYTEGTEGAACEHEHTEDCYTLVKKCIHKHDESCYPVLEGSVSENTATSSEVEEAQPTECTHECSEESGCITKELSCPHERGEHDDSCGYIPATEGTPCGYICEQCNSQDSGLVPGVSGNAPAECICETHCKQGAVDPDCPVCSAEDADLSACKGTEETVCICTDRCSEEMVNPDCPICSAENADFSACLGKEAAALAAFALPQADHTHCVCGGNGDVNGHEHDTAGTEWTKTDALPVSAGNYYLTQSVSGSWTVPKGKVNLCLNGQTINGKITIGSGATLTLTDCIGSGRVQGEVTVNGGKFELYGGTIIGGVEVGRHSNPATGSAFTMYGGTISGGRYGAYIYDDHGAFRMLGGKITGSQTGIYLNSSRNSLTIGGDANVTGSTRNVYLDSGVLTIDPSLTQAARIGITTSRQPTDDVPVQFAAGASNTALDCTKIFLPDAAGQGYVVTQEQDKLYLSKHQHSWAYTASGTTITAACTNADGTCPDTNGGSVTLSAPDQTLFYNGMARAASCTSSLTTGDAAIITYYAKPADSTALSGAPVNAGDYIARIQLGEASVSVSYTIEKVRLLVTANSTVIDYGTAPMHDGVSCQGFVNNEDIDDLDGTPTYAHTYRQFDDVGEYTITPGGLTSDNYDISFLPGTLEVRPRTVTLTWHNTEGRIYADDEGAITATVSNAVNGDRIGVTVTGGELTAGTHTAAATGLTGDKAKNYQLSTVDADRTVQYTVAQAAQTLTFAQQGSLTRTYGDDAFSNAASNNCRDGGSITYASSRESVATVASDGTVTIHAAGEATITATAAETANYQQSAASYTLRVSPKGVTITGLQA